MFVKITKSKKYTYVQLIHGYRVNGKVKHKVLVNLGRLDKLQDEKTWDSVLGKLSKILNSTTLINVKECKSEQISNWGYLVYKKLWHKFKLPQILGSIQDNSKKTFKLNDSCFLMAVQHLLNPSSKLKTYQQQAKYIKHPEVGINHLYRSLDIMCQMKEQLEQHIFTMNRNLYNMKIDVVFYDVTTFHFESTIKDELKNFGFSKANKINEVQVVLGMLVDCEGRPIGYELFPGNTFEGKTLENALNSLEKKFGIRNIIIVADRGLNSKLNLKQIKDRKYGYIVASRIKNLPKKTQDKIFEAGYQDLGELRYKILDYHNRIKDNKKIIELSEKLIITYSKKRAHKDKADRQRLLDKTEYLLRNKSAIKSSNKRGGKKYLKDIGSSDWVLDNETLASDEKFDGYYGIQTSEQNLNVERILEAYHTLWKIEESFRIMKSNLEVRPIFHWTEKRIRGHFVICFLAFLLERTLEFELHNEGNHASPCEIRDALNAMQFTEMDCAGKKYLLTAPLTKLGEKILNSQKIKTPSNSIPIEKLNIQKIIT